MTKDGEQFFKYVLDILDCSFENSVWICTQSLFELFGILMSNFLSSLYILDINPLSDMELVKAFSHSVDCHFILLTVSLMIIS